MFITIVAVIFAIFIDLGPTIFYNINFGANFVRN